MAAARAWRGKARMFCTAARNGATLPFSPSRLRLNTRRPRSSMCAASAAARTAIAAEYALELKIDSASLAKGTIGANPAARRACMAGMTRPP